MSAARTSPIPEIGQKVLTAQAEDGARYHLRGMALAEVKRIVRDAGDDRIRSERTDGDVGSIRFPKN